MGESAFHRLLGFFTAERTEDFAHAVLILGVTLIGARLVGRWARRVAGGGGRQRSLVFGRLSSWAVLFFGLTTAFQELGFKLSVLLGAAGVLSVAIGFASQTTLSNLISGFFLFGESPFRVGDTLEVDGLTGEVLSIDVMATTLRTADNRFVRIPNETLIKTKLVNQTRFPLRRLDLTIRIPPRGDFAGLRTRILELLERHPLCLAEPPPLVFVSDFGADSTAIQVSVWTETKHLLRLRAALSVDLPTALHAAPD